MKFKTVTHYVEKSFEDKPSFVIVLEDLDTGKEISYISNGCQFVENTEENVGMLVEEYDCKVYLEELFDNKSKIENLDSIVNGSCMFSGCTNLTQFTSDLPNLVNGYYMFEGCTDLTQFTLELPNLVNGSCMFYGCTNLTQFTSDLPKLVNGMFMFEGCTNLTQFTSDLPKLVDGRFMFYGCTNLKRT